MNCYKCNTGGYSPGELVRHEVYRHGYPEPKITPVPLITIKAEVERRIAKAIAASEAELLTARKLLWLRHGCPMSALYGDDGEMQCGRCIIDFKRSPIADIEARFQRMNFEQMKAEQDAAAIHARGRGEKP